MAQPSDGHDERGDSRCPPLSTIDWLAPRISFSRDFARPGAHLVPHETMKEISEISESPARFSSGKGSPSEFEFSMSIQGQDSSYEHTMLAADELFYEGKLLPLYNTPQSVPPTEPVVGRRRSNAEEYVMHGHAEQVSEMGRVKVEQHPISPKAPTCTSRWKELLGLKKVQIQDARDASNGKQQRKPSYQSKSDHGPAPGRRSIDSMKDPKGGLSHGEAHTHHGVGLGHAIQAQNHGVNMAQDHSTHLLSMQSDPPVVSVADPGLCPTTNLQSWQMDRAMSGSRSSKSSEDSEGVMMETHMQTNGGAAAATMVKHRNSISRAKSPTKQSDQMRASSAAMSPRRGGPRGVSPGRPSVGNRPTESSRSAIATRLVVRGLDRSYSSPKPLKKRPEQLRSGRQRASTDGSRSLERSTSYSAGVRVTPVINVPMYITPGLRKGSKNGIFGLTHLFSSKKEKAPKLSSAQHHHNHTDG